MSERRILRPRLRGLLAASLLAALALTGCQAIPGAGPVQEGLQSLDQADQPVQFTPGGPTAGATQEDIVRGFVITYTNPDTITTISAMTSVTVILMPGLPGLLAEFCIIGGA